MGAVVTTRAIADSFDNGMEFFSTFGGSTAACVAGSHDTAGDPRRGAAADTHSLVGERLLSGLKPLDG